MKSAINRVFAEKTMFKTMINNIINPQEITQNSHFLWVKTKLKHTVPFEERVKNVEKGVDFLVAK